MTPDPIDASTEADVRVALARFEAKLDVALAQHGGRLDAHGSAIADHEERLRYIERTPTVSPRQLGAVAFSIIAALAAVSPLLSRIYA